MSWQLISNLSTGCFLQAGSDDLVKDMVGQTSGFMPRDMHALIANAGEPGAVQDSKSPTVVPHALGKEDLTKALERSKKRNASALGTPKVNEANQVITTVPLEKVCSISFHCRTIRR